MKAKDIKPGVVYGYRRSKYSPPEPIVFLAPVDADHLYRTASHHRPEGTPAHLKTRSGAKPGRGSTYSSPTIGYPAVLARSQPDAAALTEATLADFEAATSVWRGDDDNGYRIEYMLVTTLGHIIGPYEDALAAAQAEREARDERATAEQAARESAQARAKALKQTLADAGITATSDDPWRPTALVLSLDELEKLLARL